MTPGANVIKIIYGGNLFHVKTFVFLRQTNIAWRSRKGKKNDTQYYDITAWQSA
jgi:hypothetical protein